MNIANSSPMPGTPIFKSLQKPAKDGFGLRAGSRQQYRDLSAGIPDRPTELPFLSSTASVVSAIKYPYPRTLIFENESTARLAVGRPMESAGRNVVKINMRFTCGNTSCESFGSERMR